MFRDRLLRIVKAHELIGACIFPGQLHETFDQLDAIAGLRTRWLTGHDGCCAARGCNSIGNILLGCRRSVGARLALHEFHLHINGKSAPVETIGSPSPNRFYHWLGQEAE